VNATRLWLLGGSVLIVAVLVLGWFAAISPALSQAASNEIDRATVAEQNQVYEADLAQLKLEFENLASLKGELDQLAIEVPPTADLPGLIRIIEGAASASSVTVTGIQPSTPLAFVAALPEIEPTVPADGAVPTDESTAEPDSSSSTVPSEVETLPAEVAPGEGGVVPIDPADVAVVSAGGFYTMEVQIQVAGDLGQALAIVSNLQSAKRIFLVTAVNAQSGESPSSTITGLVFVRVDPETPTPTETPTP
jgi:hypothetical protein